MTKGTPVDTILVLVMGTILAWSGFTLVRTGKKMKRIAGLILLGFLLVLFLNHSDRVTQIFNDLNQQTQTAFKYLNQKGSGPNAKSA